MPPESEDQFDPLKRATRPMKLPPEKRDNVHVAPNTIVHDALDIVLQAVDASLGVGSPQLTESVKRSYTSVDYILQFEILAPNFRDPVCPNEPGWDPRSEDHVFDVDLRIHLTEPEPHCDYRRQAIASYWYNSNLKKTLVKPSAARSGASTSTETGSRQPWSCAPITWRPGRSCRP